MTPQQVASLLARYPFTPVVGPDGTIGNRIRTCPVRIQWPQLDRLAVHPKYPDGKPQCGATLIIPPAADISKLDTLGKAVASQVFGAILNKPIVVRDAASGQEVRTTVARQLAWPWRSQLKYAGKPGFSEDGAGHFIRANSLFLPRILDQRQQPMANSDPGIYAGMWAIAVLDLNAYPKDGGKQGDETKRGVRATLVSLMKLADDDVLPSGGNGNADEAFAGIEVPADLLSASAPAGAPALASGADISW